MNMNMRNTHREKKKDTDFGMQLPEGSGAIPTVTKDTPGYTLGAQQVCNGHRNKCE